MVFKKKTSEKIDKVVKKSVDFELSIADVAKRSERRAWMVAWASLVMSFCLAGGIFYIMPHMERREPYLIMADMTSGTATLARLSETGSFDRMSANKAVNNSNVAQYVIARESYEPGGVVSDRDRRVVYTMSSSEVRNAYLAGRTASNPESPAAKYGRRYAIRVRISSLVLEDALPGRPPPGAVVRFQRSLYDTETGVVRLLDNKIATMQFTYMPEIKLNERDSIVNPLRFHVTRYRVDQDFSTPSPEYQAPPGGQTSPDSAGGNPAVPPIDAQGVDGEKNVSEEAVSQDVAENSGEVKR